VLKMMPGSRAQRISREKLTARRMPWARPSLIHESGSGGSDGRNHEVAVDADGQRSSRTGAGSFQGGGIGEFELNGLVTGGLDMEESAWSYKNDLEAWQWM